MRYQAGFGNTFCTEAVKGALPVGQNSPQKTPRALISRGTSQMPLTAARRRRRGV